MKHERVLVTRRLPRYTERLDFASGYRVGPPATLKTLDMHRSVLDYHAADINVLSAAAAIAINRCANVDRQRVFNRKAIELTVSTFKTSRMCSDRISGSMGSL
jgi:hypothetical protein